MSDNLQIIKSVLLYILKNGSDKIRSNVYYIVKTAFFSQQKHLVKYLCPIFKDTIMALKFGPVPSNIYDILKISRGDSKTVKYHSNDEIALVSQSIAFEDETFLPKEDPDMDYLSPSSIECLDDAIKQVSDMSFDDILSATHGDEWQRAYNSSGNHIMDILEIVKEAGIHGDELNYLKENILYFNSVA